MKIERNIPFLNYDGRDAGREFRQWLKANSSVFKGYNYEGSGITTITDILGQYLMQTGYMANMVYNESDILRSKIWTNKASISSAKGYTPHKKLGSRIKCNILIESNETTNINKRNYVFIGHKNDVAFPFVLLQNHSSQKYSDMIQSFNSIELVQGTWENFSYHVTDPGFTRFTIEDNDIDISTLKVYVYIDKTSKLGTEYKQIKHISDINNSSYILILDSSNRYSLVFGDDKLANKPPVGSTIFIEYVKTNGEKCNDINHITLTTLIDDNEVISINTEYNSYGGVDIESMQSIEMNGTINSTLTDPKTYYKTLLKSHFPNITDINVVDGELLNPPRYGVVYIYAAIGKSNIPLAFKRDMIEVLKKYKNSPCIFTIEDPKTVEIDVVLDINFKNTNHDKSKSEFRNIIVSLINEYKLLHYGKITSEWFPTELTHYIKSNVDVKINNSKFIYKINLPISNPGINAEYNVEIPTNIEVSQIQYNDIVLDISNNQYINSGVEFHQISNTVSFTNIIRKPEDYVLITSSDDASFINKDTYWIPIINNIDITFDGDIINLDKKGIC